MTAINEITTWAPDTSTTEASFSGWGKSQAAEALTEEYIRNLFLAVGPQEKVRIHSLIDRVLEEVKKED